MLVPQHLWLAALTSYALLASSPSPRYRLIDLGTLYGGRSVAMDVSGGGIVVGDSQGFAFSNDHAFLYDGTMHDLGADVIEQHATGVNDLGDVAGYGDVGPAHFNDHAILWSSGGMQDLGNLCEPTPADPLCVDNGEARAYGINAFRQVAGYTKTPDGGRAFLWTPGGTDGPLSNPQMRNLGSLGGITSMAKAVNDAGDVVGWSTLPGDVVAHPFLFDAAGLHDLGTLGGNDIQLLGGPTISIDNHGNVAGASQTAGGAYHAFLYSGGVMHDLGTLGGGDSGAVDINDAGQIVGFDSVFGPFLYGNGIMQPLAGLISNPGDWSLQEVRAINNAGQIAGYASSPTFGVHAVLLVPEESTPCPSSIEPASRNVNFNGASGQVKVTAPGCTWSAVSNASWITVNAAGGVGNGHVRYSVAATADARVGTITIAGQTFTVIQSGPPGPRP